MEWLIIVGLGIWALLLQQRLDGLTRRLFDLEMRLGPPQPYQPAAAPPPAAPVATSVPITPEREPLLLDTPVAPDELLLDTPLPEASNDDDNFAAPPPAPPVAPPRTEPERVEPPPRAVRKPDRRLEQWLAENGLAWLGGGAFAIGAIFMVSFATQQSWFTPQVQLVCAVILGLALLAASEWARRYSLRKPPGHPLAASLLAGAGVVAFYATAWAAHGLYTFIGWPAAAALLTLCAALLFGLSLLHGQAIGILAIAAALLAPALTHSPTWPPLGLVLYIGAVALAGLLLAAFKRWPWVAAAAIAALYFWFATAIIDGQARRALALLVFAAAGGILIAFRPPLEDDATKQRLSWRTAHDLLPTAAITVSSVLLILPWGAATPSGVIAGPAWVGAMFVALAATAVRARVAAPATLVVAIAFQAIGFALFLDARPSHGPLGSNFYPFVLLSSVVIVLSALGAKPNHRARLMTAIAAASGAALLTILAATSRPDWHSFSAYAPLFAGAALMAVAAWFVARGAQNPRADWSTDTWAGAGALLLLLGIESALAPETRTAAHAGAALMFAYAFSSVGWRALRVASLTAAAVTVAHALSPNLFGAALAGTIPLWGALIILAVAALLLFGAGYFAAQEQPRSMSAEGLNSASVIVVLIGVFLALRWIAAGGAGAPLDGLTETSLRALALIAAGHIVMPRAAQDVGRIGQWRGHAFMGAGLLYAIAGPGWWINPWWGITPATVIGPYLLDTLIIAFAAPAALSLYAANRLYTRQRWAARGFAAAGGLLALMWASLTLRRAFHVNEMPTALVGLFEGACYALVFLGGALAVALVARARAVKHADGPFTQDLNLVTRACAWVGFVVAVWIMVLDRHPWWGIQEAQATTNISTALAILAQAVAVALALLLGRALSRSPVVERTRFAAASAAIVFAWSFGHAAIRWAYHQGAMDDGGIDIIGIEGILQSLWPLALVLIGSRVTQLAPHRDSIRPYVYDLQAIWATAVWPALGFAVLGLWLIFNPWWGLAPARGVSTWTEIIAPATPILAAWLTKMALGVPHVRKRAWFERTVSIVTIAHLFLALTLIVRWLYHGDAMSQPSAVDIEMWTYSAVWAMYGAAVFWLGMQRNDAVLRWSGLTILIATTAYVFFLTFTRLQGVAQFGSALGLAVVLMGVAWFARVNRKPPEPGDLVNVTPGARRERRRGRRQRTP